MENQVSLKSFFLSLSSLLDKGNRDISEHQLRTSYIAWKIGEKYGLDSIQLNHLIIASLIHDIGALTLEEKSSIYYSSLENEELHSYKGWYVLQKIPNFSEIANTVKHHHTSYKKLGENNILAQIINIADSLDRLIKTDIHLLVQKDKIIENIINNEDFHPKLKNIVIDITKPEKFWFDISDNNLLYHLNDSPICEIPVNKETMISLAYLIKDIVDFKSPFTVAHSNGVMYCALTLGEKLNFSQQDLETLVLAALFHDVGKITVPNNIIMKNGPLNHLEKSIMMQHPYYTYRFLKNAGYSKEIYYAASTHHEGLDGKGYPFKFDAQRLTELEKIMAVCDVFVALVEDRPYRKGMSMVNVEHILNDLSNSKLDKNYVKEILEIRFILIEGMKDINLMSKGEFEIFKEVIKIYRKFSKEL